MRYEILDGVTIESEQKLDVDVLMDVESEMHAAIINVVEKLHERYPEIMSVTTYSDGPS